MSGPSCNTCEYFMPFPIIKDGRGQCNDPSKIIYAKYGNAINDAPITTSSNECLNHLANKAET